MLGSPAVSPDVTVRMCSMGKYMAVADISSTEMAPIKRIKTGWQNQKTISHKGKCYCTQVSWLHRVLISNGLWLSYPTVLHLALPPPTINCFTVDCKGVEFLPLNWWHTKHTGFMNFQVVPKYKGGILSLKSWSRIPCPHTALLWNTDLVHS